MVLLFLDTGGVSDHKTSGQPRMVHTLLDQELTEILSENKNKQTKILAWKIDIAPRTVSHIIKQDLGLSNRTTPYHCIKRK